jgi:D-glycero-alpha-D-manno-heptose 1-phosphate guanylyltransferase
MEAIILAGGFGTRLSHIIKDVPKPMAPVCGNPFLKYIIDDLAIKGITRIIMAVGYKQDVIVDYFGTLYRNIKISYSREEYPLLTGGAIKKALKECEEESILIINGDTFFDVDLNGLINIHKNNNADITIALKYLENFERYGTVEFNNNKIIAFEEKKYKEKGYINGGIYVIKKNLLELNLENKFSLEEYITNKVLDINIFAFLSDGYFIDIGVPADYEKVQIDFKEKYGYLK